ncbi:hypothetical protein WA158_004475 [Blastocystis sp. Blastoise]
MLNFLIFSCFFLFVLSFDNGLGLKPQMGFNTWNKFQCDIHEQLARDTADVMIEKGLLKAGYEYLNLDDCWQIARDNVTKRIIEDPKAFPSGMKSLADYVHSKGLKFGLYSDAGELTCQRRPGSYGYEQIDADTYSEWGVDYLKYDNCFDLQIPPEHRYPLMAEAFKKTKRNMFLSMCEWGKNKPYEWGRLTGNSWRTTEDIWDLWCNMMDRADENEPLWRYAGPGGWNDPDMLEVGNGGMTNEEYKVHFSLWCIMKAPLLIGCDITKASEETFEILLNQELIAINQDSLGVQGHRVWSNKYGNQYIDNDIKPGDYEVWSGPLIDGSFAVLLLNRSDEYKDIEITSIFKDCGMRENTTAYVRDLWKHEDLGIFTNEFTALVGRHSVVVLRVTPKLM